jgi:hypothetical protein
LKKLIVYNMSVKRLETMIKDLKGAGRVIMGSGAKPSAYQDSYNGLRKFPNGEKLYFPIVQPDTGLTTYSTYGAVIPKTRATRGMVGGALMTGGTLVTDEVTRSNFEGAGLTGGRRKRAVKSKLVESEKTNSGCGSNGSCASGAGAKSSWMSHVKAYRASHPGVSLKQAMVGAKATYKSKGKPTGGAILNPAGASGAGLTGGRKPKPKGGAILNPAGASGAGLTGGRKPKPKGGVVLNPAGSSGGAILNPAGASGAGLTGGRKKRAPKLKPMPTGGAILNPAGASGAGLTGGKRPPNKWMTHLAAYRKSHPGLSLKAAMVGAKSSYKK